MSLGKRLDLDSRLPSAELVQGDPEPFKALWSRSDDTVIMGAFGGWGRS